MKLIQRLVPAMLTAATLSGLLMTSGCGKGEELPSDVSSSLSSSLKSSVSTDSGDDDIKAAIPKILQGLEDIKTEIKGLQVSPISTGATGSTGTTTKPGTTTGSTGTTTKPGTTTGSTGTTTKPGTTTGSTGTTTKPGTTTGSTGTTAKPSTPAAATPSANDEFKKMLQMLGSKSFVQANVEKTEKSFKDAHVSQVKLVMYTKSPSLVKIDVISSSSGAAGAKVIYNSGDKNKAKVRPGGSLSFVTTELPKTDDRLLSTNGYTFDDIDIFGVVKRWSSGYTAELIGKSKLADGTSIYILKVKASGTNALDDRIDYEYIGYEPDTYKMRMWEIYTPGVKDPFFRLNLTKIDYPASIPDSTFKL